MTTSGVDSWHSYPKVWNIGHANVSDIFKDPVLIEEKVDGSQFSFGRFEGVLRVRSRGKEMVVDAPEKMFSQAVETVQGLPLHDGWTYRAEYLSKPKHNVLAYDRIPKGCLVVFDINPSEEKYLPYESKVLESDRLGLECVPVIYQGIINSPEQLLGYMDRISFLGGQKIEGLVCKNYDRFGADGKAWMAKHVSESFKEMHKTDWKITNPGQGDIIERLGNMVRTEARWHKAVQHLKEAGKLENSPRDIGLLIREMQKDLDEECGDEVTKALLDWAMPKITRMFIAGFPEWYKNQLITGAFK